MSCECVPFDASTLTYPRARKAHRCDECDFPIARGERHVRVTGICDGEPSSHRFHVECDEFRDALERHIREGQAAERARNRVAEDWHRVSFVGSPPPRGERPKPSYAYNGLCDCIAYGQLAEALDEFTRAVHGYDPECHLTPERTTSHVDPSRE